MRVVLLIALSLIIGLGLKAQNRDIVREEFYTNGNLKLQFISLGNKLVEATYFFENGAIYEMGFYLDGKLTGNWLTFDSNNELQTSAYFMGDKKVGIWRMYENGVLAHKVSYSQIMVAEL